MHRWGVTFLAAALLAVTPARAQEALLPQAAVQRAGSLIAAGDAGAAVPLLEAAGRNWYPEADLRLGLLFLEGSVVPRDVARAARHLERAAHANWMRVEHKRGHPDAQYELARLVATGHANGKPATAYRLYKAAARAGHEGAQLALARKYAHGEGTRMNEGEAYRWALIARAGDAPAVREEASRLAGTLRERIAFGLAERVEREALRFRPVDS